MSNNKMTNNSQNTSSSSFAVAPKQPTPKPSSLTAQDARKRQVLESIHAETEGLNRALLAKETDKFVSQASALLHRNYHRVLQFDALGSLSSRPESPKLPLQDSATSFNTVDSDETDTKTTPKGKRSSNAGLAGSASFPYLPSSNEGRPSASVSGEGGLISFVHQPHTRNSIYQPLSARNPTFYDLEVARLGTDAVRFVKLVDIPTIVPIRPYTECNKSQRKFFWYAGQHFPEFAERNQHQVTPNLIFLVTGICPLTVSGWRIRGGEYTLYIYFRSERDLRLARALMNGRVQMSRDEQGEPGAIIYSQPEKAMSDGDKAVVFPADAAREPEPELCFRLEAQRPSTRQKAMPPRYEDAASAGTTGTRTPTSASSQDKRRLSGSESGSSGSDGSVQLLTPPMMQSYSGRPTAPASGRGYTSSATRSKSISPLAAALAPRPRSKSISPVTGAATTPVSSHTSSFEGELMPRGRTSTRGSSRGDSARGSAARRRGSSSDASAW